MMSKIPEELNQLKKMSTWQDRYKCLISFSRLLPSYPEALKNDEHLVKGCENPIWLSLNIDSNGHAILNGDSSSRIIKGILASIFMIIKDKSLEEILLLDIKNALEEYGIYGNLASSKQAGITHIIDRIRQLALNAKLT